MTTTKRILTLALLSATALGAIPIQAEPKQDLSTRTNDAALSCIQYLHDNAKDPESIQIDETSFTNSLGFGLSRNHIFINFTGMGRNTYGAVLKHNWECDTVCKQGQNCQVQDFKG